MVKKFSSTKSAATFERPRERANLLRTSADLSIVAMVADCFDLDWRSSFMRFCDLDDPPRHR